MDFSHLFFSTGDRHGLRGLRQASLLTALAAGLVVGQAIAGPRLENIEQCVESATDIVSLPGVAAGGLMARECAACESLLLNFSPSTRYFIGDEPVSYARLRTVASKRPMSLYVFYQTGTRTLTRLRLDAGADAASK